MPNSVVCPACDTRLRIPDNYQAKAARCPKCKGVVPIVVEMEVVEDEVDVFERPQPKKKLRRERVRTLVLGPGIGLISIGAITTLFGLIVFVWYIYQMIVASRMARQLGPGARIEWEVVFLGFAMLMVEWAIGAFILFAGVKMVRLQNYVAAMVGCVILTLVSGCGAISMLIGTLAAPGATMPGAGSIAALSAIVAVIPLATMGIGIWGFVTLLFENVRRAFT